ncbi:ARM repeat superfamily protein [Actinidia rufa]|uniref:ARM repeat superfamily protein n=1 Tax=Actinidia rufa TaxID=165716 RepID=A0A7J0DFA0_9ERIC|nr:ARM repeat superfamily protein [Actinidia rufa]
MPPCISPVSYCFCCCWALVIASPEGSAKVRVEAFMTLPILVAKVGTPDALAFFLPAIDQAIRGLAEFFMIVLEDDANLSGLGTTGDISKDESTMSFLEELRSLPVKTQGQSEMVAENPSEAIRKDVPNFGFKGKGSVNAENMTGSLHVSRTKDWIIKTYAHVNKLLSGTFPQVGSYNEFWNLFP